MDELVMKESREQRTGPKVRKTVRHYGTQGGEHRPLRGGGYRRPTNVRWEEMEDFADE